MVRVLGVLFARKGSRSDFHRFGDTLLLCKLSDLCAAHWLNDILVTCNAQALEHVVFDGNPIGEQGAKTLMVSSLPILSRVCGF
jgi:hypothetical protein